MAQRQTKGGKPVQQLFDLTGRVALITGASGHLGSALSAALSEAGARLVVASRNLQTAKQVASSLDGSESGRHLGVAIDQMDEASIERGFKQAVKEAGQIDILVNNG